MNIKNYFIRMFHSYDTIMANFITTIRQLETLSDVCDSEISSLRASKKMIETNISLTEIENTKIKNSIHKLNEFVGA